MHFCCTVFFVRLFKCSAPVFYFFDLCCCRQTHTDTQNTHCSGFGCFSCSVCWRLRVAAAFSVGVKGRRRESAHRESLFLRV
ncbi:putative trans-sialidase [Trypanosoma cruzi Dm28c]|uniref:Putative trans-sialidase n=1 Tax=Trypanosoma cruzi Dm28c TaxID=1416333 RepID=V5A3X0_TRYCR|nr:putative trans-sialidase [Trypanosoma cruzi Dm28c]